MSSSSNEANNNNNQNGLNGESCGSGDVSSSSSSSSSSSATTAATSAINEIFVMDDDDPKASNSKRQNDNGNDNGGENGKLSQKCATTTTIADSNNDDDDNSDGSNNDNNDKNDENHGNDSAKRQRPFATGLSPSAVAMSPPNFVSFEEIMRTANDMSRMALVNEIVLNKDFKIEKSNTTTTTNNGEESGNGGGAQNSLEKAIRENMQKAFWDILREQLQESPPNYRQAISLLNEIRETLLLFLMPQHTQLRNEINDILDMPLIEQQAENGIFEFQRFAQYILSVCSRLCCPARDEMIRRLTQTTELIPLLKGIFELLETMRIDFANFYIEQFRPHIQLASVEYEREKFKKLLETHQKYQIDVLEFTARWLKRNYQSIDLSQESELKNMFNKTLIAAYVDLLRCLAPSFECHRRRSPVASEQRDNNGSMENSSTASSSSSTSAAAAAVSEDDFPETLLLIRPRIESIRDRICRVTLISGIFVVTFAAIGEPLQSVKAFREQLKRSLEAIVVPAAAAAGTSSAESKSTIKNRSQLLQYTETSELKSILTNAALQVCAMIEPAIEQYQRPSSSLSPSSSPSSSSSSSSASSSSPLERKKKLDSLTFQIEELASPNSRIRAVMERRILEFIERVISSATAVPIQVPSGLSSFASELTQIAGEFTRLVAYNRAVYSPHYTKIIGELASATHYISPNELKDIEKTLYN